MNSFLGTPGTSSFTLTNSSLATVPGIGFSVTIDVASSAGFAINQYVFIETIGTFQVTTKPTAINMTITNFGSSDIVVPPGTTIPINKMVNVAGKQGIQGISSFSFSNTTFIVPGIGFQNNVGVITSAPYTTGQFVFVFTGGFFQIFDIPDGVTLTLTNLGDVGNASPGFTVAPGQKITPSGPRGQQGLGSSSTTNATFNIPGIGYSTPVSVVSSAPFGVGQYIQIATAGFFQIESIGDGATITVINWGWVG